MTKIPTSQSATAKLITKRFVTVLNLRVVMTERITKVFPIIVVMMSKENSTISTIFAHGQLSASELLCSVTFIFNHGNANRAPEIITSISTLAVDTRTSKLTSRRSSDEIHRRRQHLKGVEKVASRGKLIKRSDKHLAGGKSWRD